jgi:acyl-coenzyme A thioesterase PaaI-like protein
MTPTPAHLEAFASIEWAAPYLKSPKWEVGERTRGREHTPGGNTDGFNRETIRQNDGIHYWLELHPKTAPDTSVEKTITLVTFGNGLSGFTATCHGGALLTLMDEALGYLMMVNEDGVKKAEFTGQAPGHWKKLLEAGVSPTEVLVGWYVTSSLESKFLKPVPCPGLVGIETELLEKKRRMMKMRATMKDAKGTPLMRTTGVWVRLGPAKL